MSSEAPAPVSRKWLRLTFIEWVVVGVIAAILAALLIPPPKWCASGFIAVPIRVAVFDATQGQPIKDARVTMLKERMDLRTGTFPELSASVLENLQKSAEHLTDAAGIATIHQEFTTGANYKSPESFVILSNHWIAVSADGYAPVMTTLRYDTELTETLRKQQEFVVAIGLMRQSD